MRLSIFVGVVALLLVAKGAFAACASPSVQVQDAALTSLMSNSIVCASSGGDSWQEEHHGNGGGELWDYKLGPTDSIDPSTKVGSWSVTEDGINSVVTYTYDTFEPNAQHDFTVWANNPGDGIYSFCGVGSTNDVHNVSVSPGVGPCP